MSAGKSYNDLKRELDLEIAWFEGDAVSLEEAPKHYKKAKHLLRELENLLNKAELEIEKIK